MPAATVADGPAFAHSSHQVDTPSNVITDPSVLLAALWAPNFPSPDLVREAAALFPRAAQQVGPDVELTEGPRCFVRVGPGVVAIRSKDFARAERRPGNEGAIERLGLAGLGQSELTIVEGELLARAARDMHIPLEKQSRYADLLASYLRPCTDSCAVPCDLHPGELPGDRLPTRVITQWSRKSRSYMTETLGMLDYTPMYSDPSRLPTMLTLTYPGCWLTVAPNGKTVKKHMKALRKRYERHYGEKLRCVWKLEFQRRVFEGTNIPNVCVCQYCDGLDDGRAPHIHMLMVPPHVKDGVHFKTWLSFNWADIVDHPDAEHRQRHHGAGTSLNLKDGMKARDPKRVGVYFTKHGTFGAKEYQHEVPQAWQEPGEGPGRFWGYWGLEKTSAEQLLTPWVADAVGQVMRRYSRAQRTTRQVTRPRVKGGRPVSQYPEVIGLAGAMLLESRSEPKYRKTRVRAVRMKSNRGFLSVNSGPEFASQLARYIDQLMDTGVVKPKVRPILPK